MTPLSPVGADPRVRPGLTEHYSETGSDPARSLRQQLQEGMVVQPENALLNYFDLKRGRHVQMLFPLREHAERRAASLVKAKIARRDQIAIRTVGEALA